MRKRVFNFNEELFKKREERLGLRYTLVLKEREQVFPLR
jgi:hypothetical protein